MNIAPAARALRKEKQLARLQAKSTLISELAAAETDEEADAARQRYADFYSSDSLQQAKAAFNAEITAARQAIRAAQGKLDVAQVSGVDIGKHLAEREAAKVALETLRARRNELFGTRTTMNLTGGQ